jgi:hypothetical protein
MVVRSIEPFRVLCIAYGFGFLAHRDKGFHTPVALAPPFEAVQQSEKLLITARSKKRGQACGRSLKVPLSGRWLTPDMLDGWHEFNHPYSLLAQSV